MKKKAMISFFAISCLVAFILFQNFDSLNVSKNFTPSKHRASLVENPTFSICSSNDLWSAVITAKGQSAYDQIEVDLKLPEGEESLIDLSVPHPLPITIGPCLSKAQNNEIKICLTETPDDYVPITIKNGNGRVVFLDIFPQLSCEEFPYEMVVGFRGN